MICKFDIEGFIQKGLGRFVPNEKLHKYIWFVLLWLFGLAAVFLLAGVVRLLFSFG
jgi:hypothetical protein